MSTGQKRKLPNRLDEVRRQFEDWRRARKARTRIPERLWALAVEVAGTLGVHRTSQALRLGYYSLKERVEAEAMAADRREREAAPAFLELSPPAGQGFAAVPVGSCECTLEWEDAGGAKMRVHLQGTATPDLVALSRSFWDRVS